MNNFIKAYYKLIAITGAFAILTGGLMPMEFILSSSVKAFTYFVGSIAPGVSVMAERAINPARAELTWSVQWLLFPVYLYIWFTGAAIRGRVMREAIIKAARGEPNMCKRRFLVVFGIISIGLLILADFGVFEGGSFLRGTLFSGEVSQLPAALRAPFSSNAGMILYAWLIPMVTACYYWTFCLFVINFREYVIKPVQPEPNAK